MAAKVRDSNQSDKQGNAQAIDDLVAALSPEELHKTLYVADSALCTGPNLEKMRQADLRFITRLPDNFAASGQTKAWAEDRWMDLGRMRAERDAASYRANEQTVEIQGQTDRAVVVLSDPLDQRKALAQSVKELQHQVFYCTDDAETAAGAWRMEHRKGLFPVDIAIDPEEKVLPRDRPGRPKAGEQPALRTVDRLRCEVGEPSTQQLDDGRQRENAFILRTNVDAEDVPTPEVLREYKFQTSVETSFTFLKSLTYMDAVSVHRKDRLEALMYVLVIAALIFTLLERRVRNALENRGEKFVLPGNRQVNRPMATSLLDMLSKVIVLRSGRRKRILARSPRTQQRTARILELAGFEIDVYTTVPTVRPA